MSCALKRRVDFKLVYTFNGISNPNQEPGMPVLALVTPLALIIAQNILLTMSNVCILSMAI